jgi:DNA-binding transcriptional regulator YdaS (Cro superfamily)
MALEHSSDSALAAAVRKAGSQSAFGRLIGKRQSVVFGWLKQGKPLPGELVFEVEAKTGISRHELRPDLYPRDLAPFPAESIEPESSSE